ncbi:MAG: UPF0758 domain-containing protein [Candidatus Moranbacteria bacterium]|nr:UPF0758 domain-containing protein [Candidatus Moranbacteria bacterium]
MQVKKGAKIEWPKEKLLHYGADKLTKSELLAVILRTGAKNLDVVELAKNILRRYPKFSLAGTDAAELEKTFGLDAARACGIIACFELGRRTAEEDRSSDDVAVQETDNGSVEGVPEEDPLAKFGTANFSGMKS